MTRRDFAIQYLMERLEGEYAEDAGGPTYWGITTRFYQDEYESVMGHWPPIYVGAKMFYERWWDELRCDLLPPGAAEIWFWFSVHIGKPRAKRLLQETLAAQLSLKHLKADGVIGPITSRAMLETNMYNQFPHQLRKAVITWYEENLPHFTRQAHRRIWPEP